MCGFFCAFLQRSVKSRLKRMTRKPNRALPRRCSPSSSAPRMRRSRRCSPRSRAYAPRQGVGAKGIATIGAPGLTRSKDATRRVKSKLTLNGTAPARQHSSPWLRIRPSSALEMKISLFGVCGLHADSGQLFFGVWTE